MLSNKCRKHPASTHHPGVCSACLRDRLVQLADAYNAATDLHSRSSLAAYRYDSFSLSSASTSNSPVYDDLRRAKHVRNASDAAVESLSYAISGVGGALKRSRSIATAAVVKRKGSFWKKLLRMREKRGSNGVFLLRKSRTLRDRFDE
uniref:Uncharacterized protein n=1 Tax=Kalanchoe fedtschenkoi TaxID=63787 RepID=A0A7N0T6B7_KALFE